MSRSAARALLALSFLAPTSTATESIRVATFNIQSIDIDNSGYAALVNVLKRMDADVVLLQEITENVEVAQVATLAAAAGYSFSRVSDTSGTLSGNLRNAVVSRFAIASHASWSSAELSGDPSANDITRDILQVVLTVPEVCQPVALFTVHLKAGSTSTDSFRRAVEIKRLKKAVENYLLANPNAHVIIGGDCNEDIGDGPFGNSYAGLPSGLPVTYELGNDVSFPVVYDPFAVIGGIGGVGLSFADATQEDCSNCYATRESSGRRLDYLWTRLSVPVLGDEVYSSLKDDGVDAAPLGFWLYKFGAPLSASASATASDHYPVFVDYLLEGCEGSRYGSGYPGNHSLTPRAGAKGSAVPGSGSLGMRLLYARPATSTILVLGQDPLLPPFGLSLSPFVPGAFLHVAVTNYYGLFTLATDGKGEATLPLALPNSPTVLGLDFNTQWFVTDANGPNGIGAMSDAYTVTVH